TLLATGFFALANAHADWPQAAGPLLDFSAPGANVPIAWSVSLDQNIAWRATLPETGQSAPTIMSDRVFITTMKPVGVDSQLGSDIIAYCFSAHDGQLLWKRDIPGKYTTRLSAPFGDASSPPAATDGQHVWFVNPTGQLACFDLDGNEHYRKNFTSVARTRPTLVDGKLILHRQVYLPDEKGKFGFENKNAEIDLWTQLQALDAKTGEVVWTSRCGVNMGCVPMVQQLDDGTQVMVVGRGGGHGPPERPEGVSMIRLSDGATLWTLELKNFMSTQTYPIVNDMALVFHKGEHLWINTATGQVDRRVTIVDQVPVDRWASDGRRRETETLPAKKPRSITQQSNLRVGDYHYFRSYTHNYLGRVDIVSGDVEYLELPIQFLREPGQKEQLLWNAMATDKKSQGIHQRMLKYNVMRNARGIEVMGDERARGNGWGHICSPIPTAFGDRLIIPIMSGMVFVVQADAKVLDKHAILAMNDLGPLGDAFTRCSVTTDGQRIYARTIKELIAIESPQP
ncbi:MAG: PQQ-binding-like beta-propeller repeat protein, partial [Planctomycetota bacterium]